MSAGLLRYTMVVRHPDTAQATALLGGEPVPDWATDLVQVDDVESVEDKPAKTPAKKAAAKRPPNK